MLPDWREDVRRCHEEHRMPGIRLHPNFHGYRLEDAVFADLLKEAAPRKLIVQLALRMDDIRVQHPLIKVADLDPAPLLKLLPALPPLRLVILNSYRAAAGPLRQLASLPGVYIDCAMWEGVGSVAALIETASAERALFGSHLPLFPLESSLLKLRESALTASQSAAFCRGNALRLLA